jgi:hypothetical protein
LFFRPLTFDLMQTNRPTNAFNFFRMTLPSVEGKYQIFIIYLFQSLGFIRYTHKN